MHPGFLQFLIVFTKNREKAFALGSVQLGTTLFPPCGIGLVVANYKVLWRTDQSRRWKSLMWKVRRVEDQGRLVLKLIGRLEGNQLAELEDAFGSEAVVPSLILDLTDVRLVDQEAVRFLADCEASGVQLRNYPAYIREWIDAEKASPEATLNQH